jgi:hypothetical protein
MGADGSAQSIRVIKSSVSVCEAPKEGQQEHDRSEEDEFFS